MDAQAWVALAALTFMIVLSLIGMAVYLIGKIETVRETMHEKNDELHERLNAVRDQYVRRDDLKEHLEPLKTSLQKLHDEIQNLAGRLK